MNPWIDVAGLSLVHFLWEGAIIAAFTGMTLWLLRDRLPQTRYALACAGLIAMLAAPIFTAAALSRSMATPERATTSRPIQGGSDTDTVPDARSILSNLSMARSLPTVDLLSPGPRGWLLMVVSVWVAGVGVLLVRLLGGWWRIHRLHRASRVAEPSAWAGTAARIAASLGLSHHVRRFIAR
jgi:bla regulator protein BlaR1